MERRRFLSQAAATGALLALAGADGAEEPPKEKTMVHVIAAIEVAPGRRDDYLAIFRKLVPKVRAEAGCIEYGPTVDAKTDIKLQAPLRDNVVTVVEKWESLDALKVHLGAPHMGEYRDQVKDIVTGLTLHILQPA